MNRGGSRKHKIDTNEQETMTRKGGMNWNAVVKARRRQTSRRVVCTGERSPIIAHTEHVSVREAAGINFFLALPVSRQTYLVSVSVTP